MMTAMPGTGMATAIGGMSGAQQQGKVLDGQYTQTIYTMIKEQKYLEVIKILERELQASGWASSDTFAMYNPPRRVSDPALRSYNPVDYFLGYYYPYAVWHKAVTCGAGPEGSPTALRVRFLCVDGSPSEKVIFLRRHQIGKYFHIQQSILLLVLGRSQALYWSQPARMFLLERPSNCVVARPVNISKEHQPTAVGSYALGLCVKERAHLAPRAVVGGRANPNVDQTLGLGARIQIGLWVVGMPGHSFPRSRAALSLLGYAYYHVSQFALAAEIVLHGSRYQTLVELCPEVEEYKIYHAQSLFKVRAAKPSSVVTGELVSLWFSTYLPVSSLRRCIDPSRFSIEPRWNPTGSTPACAKLLVHLTLRQTCELGRPCM
eukprot:3357792-Pyramimonas_sp.AAC.1